MLEQIRPGIVAIPILLCISGPAALPAAVSPEAVSPGHDERLDRIETRCPTFSWGSVPGAESYELLLYRIDRTGLEAELLIEKTLPGSAMAWTPSLESCLERGGRYGWTVRAVTGSETSEGSTPRLFHVVGAPDEPELHSTSRHLPRDPFAGVVSRSDAKTSPGAAADNFADPSLPSEVQSVDTAATTDPLLDVSGGIAAVNLQTTGAITSAASLTLDGVTDSITASTGALSFGDENLVTTGTTTTAALAISGLDCSGNANGGALTASSTGAISCSDDDFSPIVADSLDFDDFADALTADATTTIDLDTNGADLDFDAGTLFVDSSADRVGLGTTSPVVALDVVGDIAATGTIATNTGIDLGTGNLFQSPGDPASIGSVAIGTGPLSIFVSGRYAYVTDVAVDDLKVIDVSDPSAPTEVGKILLGGFPRSVFVSGRYAYVVDSGSDDLKVIDVSDPSTPAEAGNLPLGTNPQSVFVSGRYAYVVDRGSNDLKVIDISDPNAPTTAGSLTLGGDTRSVFVSGRYAYVVDLVSNDLRVIDISDPAAPALAGSVTIGDAPRSVFVSGRYAYVVDVGSDDLKVIDVADPSAPGVVGSLVIGAEPVSVSVSGRYAYVVDFDSNDLRVIDVADPINPALVGSLGIGASPASVYVSGRHAYVAGNGSNDLQVIDISGAEFSSVIAHSLEAGSLQVRESLITQGQLQVTGGATIGAGGLFSDGNVGISGTIAISNDIAPSSSPDNLIQLYAEDGSGGTSELKVRDESGQITILSPHNFSLVGEPSEPLAWSFYSENDHGRINVDMLRTVRTVERLSGEKLVHARTRDGSEIESPVESQGSLQSQVEALQRANQELRSELNRAEQRLETELIRLREELGLD